MRILWVKMFRFGCYPLFPPLFELGDSAQACTRGPDRMSDGSFPREETRRSRVRTNERPSVWKAVLFFAVAGTVCSYLWATREMCFKAWAVSRLVELKWFREIVHPAHFKEASGEDFQAAMSARRAKVDLLVGDPIVQVDMAEIHDVMLPVTDGEVMMRVYVPTALDAREEGVTSGNGAAKGVIIWLHGGGWMLGSLQSAESIAKDLAAKTGMICVSVAYRLAPEYKFPVPVKDCLAAVRWTKKYIRHFGGDGTRLALVGESAGGNIALAAALFMGRSWLPFGEGAAKRQVCAVVAASPPVSYRHAVEGKGSDDDVEWRSYRRYWEGYGLDGTQMLGYWDWYLRKPKDGNNPLASPLRASRRQLRRLPPVLLLRAAHEILWDEVTELGRRIADVGGDVQEMQTQGCIHGMFAKSGSTCGTVSLEVTTRYLQERCG